MTLTEKQTVRAGRTRLARAKKSLTPAQLFFFEHAGYSHDPKTETAEQGRRRCAIALAEAEQYAKDQDWFFDWDYDTDADDSWMTDEERRQPHHAYVCVLWEDENRVNGLASLGGIFDPDDNYYRVIEAELADEALAAERHVIESRKDAVVAMN